MWNEQRNFDTEMNADYHGNVEVPFLRVLKCKDGMVRFTLHMGAYKHMTTGFDLICIASGD